MISDYLKPPADQKMLNAGHYISQVIYSFHFHFHFSKVAEYCARHMLGDPPPPLTKKTRVF